MYVSPLQSVVIREPLSSFFEVPRGWVSSNASGNGAERVCCFSSTGRTGSTVSIFAGSLEGGSPVQAGPVRVIEHEEEIQAEP